MDAFWRAARRMLLFRGRLALAIVMAFVSAGGLGAGLLAIGPIFQAMIDQGRPLPDLAREFNERSPIDIPAGLIAALPADPYNGVAIIIAGLCVLTLFGAAANFLHLTLSLGVVERTVARIRREAFGAAISMPLAAVSSAAGGGADVVSRVINDPQQLGVGLGALLGRGVAQLSKGIAAFGAALAVNTRLTVLTLVIAPVMAVVIRKLGKRIRRAARRALEHQADLYATTGEALAALRVVKIYTAEGREASRFKHANREALAQVLRARTARAMSSPIVETMAIFAVAGLALIGIKAVADAEIAPDEIVTVLAALGVAGASLRPLTGIVNDIQHSTGAAQRLNELLARDAEPGRDRDLPRLPRHSESIAIEHASLTYPGADEPALIDVSAEIRAGETVAIVGPNGSGKTTLLSLVPRLFDPGAGRVLIDGLDIRDHSVRSLRRQIGAVTQEAVLFTGTFADNIGYGVPGAAPAAIEEAARRALAHEFIQAKGGYDARVGERGTALSGGQRQRIAIARAVLRDPAILLLDEATSMIDAESEAEIVRALAELSRGRTTLVVAHRLSTVINADRILVLDAGRLVDQGTHDELLGRCDVYRRLAERQLVRADG
ncbi:MAG: ABC transporter ATP-binding protein [Planctomycetota bacterium]